MRPEAEAVCRRMEDPRVLPLAQQDHLVAAREMRRLDAENARLARENAALRERVRRLSDEASTVCEL